VSMIRCDRRKVPYRDNPEVRADAAQRIRALLEAKVNLARQLVVLDRDMAFAAEGCSSVGHFGVTHGGDPGETRQFCDVGYAFDAFPGLEDEVRSSTVPFRSAVALGRLCRTQDTIQPADDWIQAARTSTTKDLWRAVRARIEEVAQRAPAVTEVTVYVPEATREGFDRLCVLESRRAGKPLTRGMVFVRLVDRALNDQDPDRVDPGARRMGPTSERPQSRTIPREVLRFLRQRSGDACEYPGCTHSVFIQKAHLRKSKAEGGGQEIQDLGNLCSTHHTMHDGGEFALVGWTLDFRPIFRRRSGKFLWPRGAIEPPPT
jgi:hypothetical protein